MNSKGSWPTKLNLSQKKGNQQSSGIWTVEVLKVSRIDNTMHLWKWVWRVTWKQRDYVKVFWRCSLIPRSLTPVLRDFSPLRSTMVPAEAGWFFSEKGAKQLLYWGRKCTVESGVLYWKQKKWEKLSYLLKDEPPNVNPHPVLGS